MTVKCVRSTNITLNMGNRVSTVKNNFRDFHLPCMSIPPNSANLETGANAYGNSLGTEKSRQYQEYLQLNTRERNFREYNFYNFGYTWRGCPRRQKFRGKIYSVVINQKMLFHSGNLCKF